MTSLRYYRHYIWIYLYMYLVLIVSAVIWDCVSPRNELGVPMSRFLSVVIPFVFSSLGIIIHYHSSSYFFRFDSLRESKKEWLVRFFKFNNRKNRKVSKKLNFTKLIVLNAISNIFSTIPLVALALLGIFLSSELNKILVTDIKCLFLVSFVIKHAAWYVVFFFSRVYIFRGKKRLKNII